MFVHQELKDLMSSVAKQIEGHYVENATLENCTVFKDDIVIQYRQPSRYVTAALSVMAPLDVEEDLTILIDRYNKISIAKRYYANEVFDVIIDNNHPQGISIMDALLNDTDFMNQFKDLFNNKYYIEIKGKTITVFSYVTIGGLLDTTDVNFVVSMYKIARLLKDRIKTSI